MECPRCGLICFHTQEVCDCGHDFRGGPRVPPPPMSPPREEGPLPPALRAPRALVVWGGGLLAVCCVASVVLSACLAQGSLIGRSPAVGAVCAACAWCLLLAVPAFGVACLGVLLFLMESRRGRRRR
jgi:hypothetical protein